MKDLHGRIFVKTDNLKEAARRLTPYIVDKTVFNNFTRVHLPDNCIRGDSNSARDYLIKLSSLSIHRYQWVRPLSGKYRGDLALVMHPPSPDRNYCFILVTPRFDQTTFAQAHLGSEKAVQAAAAGGKRKTHSSASGRKDRLPAKILNEEIYHAMKLHGSYRVYQHRYFLDGLEVLQAFCDKLDVKQPSIDDEEIWPFLLAAVSHQAGFAHVLKTRRHDWRSQDCVYVLCRQHAGLIGSITEVNSSDRTVAVSFISSSGSSSEELIGTLCWDDIR